MEEVLAFSTVIAIFVSAFMEMLKRVTSIHLKYVPIIAFLVGIAVGAAAYPFTELDLTLRIWAGGIAGWMASGIYETVKQSKKL